MGAAPMVKTGNKFCTRAHIRGKKKGNRRQPTKQKNGETKWQTKSNNCSSGCPESDVDPIRMTILL